VGLVVGVSRQRLDVDGAVRRLGLDLGDQPGQEQRIQIIAGCHPKGVAGLGGLKTAGVREQHLGGTQNARTGLNHPQRCVSGHHRGARTHQQGVSGEIPQALERRTDRRLVHAQTDGGSRNTALG